MIIVLATLFGTALLGAPLFLIMGATTVALFFAFGGEHYQQLQAYQTLVLQMTELTTKNIFLAIPFFVGAGAVMTEGGIAQRLVRLANSLVGWLPGGLAVSAVMSCMIFAAISASSPVTLIAVGSIMFPAMIKAGYKENFSLGLVTTGGSLGCLVPPSLPMIIYALAVSGSAAVDIGDLFLSGLGPALMISGMLSVYCVLQGMRMPAAREKFSFQKVREAAREGLWALMLPVIILGGIYSGFFTATEAAAVALVYSIFCTIFIYKELTFKRLPGLFVESTVLLGSILLIIVFSFSLNSFMAHTDAAGFMLDKIHSWELGPMGFFLVMNLLLLCIGALMDAISAILIFAPLLAPIAISLGIDPIHLGIVFIINMEIGYLMPPVATNLFVSAAVFKKSFGQVARSVLPSVSILILGLGIVMYVPTISNGLVNLLNGDPIYQAFPWDGVPDAVADDQLPSGTAQPSGPMSLQDMMNQARDQRAGEGAQVQEATEPAPQRALSMQEMMEQARQERAAAREAEEAAAGTATSEEPLSLEEMMDQTRDEQDESL